jgi:hypothetical protein
MELFVNKYLNSPTVAHHLMKAPIVAILLSGAPYSDLTLVTMKFPSGIYSKNEAAIEVIGMEPLQQVA